MIVLREAPECSEPYDGIFRQATVFIVGYDTDHEQVFARGERTAALKLAKTNKWTFDQVPARALCRDVMVRVLGS